MHEYDTALKMLLKRPAEVLIRELTHTRIAHWEDVKLPAMQNREVDLVGKAETGGYIHIELQTTNDRMMARRMAQYSLQLHDRLGEYPQQFVLYVGSAKLNMPCGLTGPFSSFQYTLVDIRDIDSNQLLNSRYVGDNVVAILSVLRDQAEAVRRILRRIVRLSPAERNQALQLFVVVSGLRRLGVTIEEEAKEVPAMYDLLDHDLLGREFKKGVRHGRKKGLEKGLERGRREGMCTGQLALLRRMITARFGSIPEWLEYWLSSRSIEELEDVGDRLLQAQTIKDLLP